MCFAWFCSFLWKHFYFKGKLGKPWFLQHAVGRALGGPWVGWAVRMGAQYSHWPALMRLHAHGQHLVLAATLPCPQPSLRRGDRKRRLQGNCLPICELINYGKKKWKKKKKLRNGRWCPLCIPAQSCYKSITHLLLSLKTHERSEWWATVKHLFQLGPKASSVRSVMSEDLVSGTSNL